MKEQKNIKEDLKKTSSKMADINSSLSLITLNVNELNTLTE